MNDGMQWIRARHSVRQYEDRPIPEDVRQKLNEYVRELNRKSGLHIQILYDEPDCFRSAMAHYGNFVNANNYIALVGLKSGVLEENCGYYGELLVLKAQSLGLNTCWVALTHGKSKAVVAPDEKEVIIISLGYGKTQGGAHRGKSAADVAVFADDDPQWYRDGVEAALLAPTAMNQQNFRFDRSGSYVTAKTGMLGPCLPIDLGIVKCHFEIGAGRENFRWA